VGDASEDDEVAGLSLEQQVANEVSAMKRSRTENPLRRFGRVFLIFQKITLIVSLFLQSIVKQIPLVVGRWHPSRSYQGSETMHSNFYLM